MEGMIGIDLEKKVPRMVPSPERGSYSFMEALLPALLIFGLILAVAYGAVWTGEGLGWKRIPISSAYAGTALVVAGLFLSVLISTASQRFAEDHSAAGAISQAFRMITNGVKGDSEVMRTLGWLAWSTYHFFRREPVSVLSEGKILRGSQPLLSVLTHQIDGMKLTPEMKLELLTQVREMRFALGGIARRRTYGVLRSRYIVNGLFSAAGVFFMSLSAATGEGNPWIGQVVSFMFAYGLTTAFVYVRHMADGIGYDPGDVRPDLSLATWLQEIEAACDNADLKDRPWELLKKE